MRPEHCPAGHELVWLTYRIGVCHVCDDDNFIYRHTGYLKRLAQLLQRAVPAQHTPPSLRVMGHARKLIPQPVPGAASAPRSYR